MEDNIKRLERFSKEIQEEIKNNATKLVRNTSLSQESALRIELDFMENCNVEAN